MSVTDPALAAARAVDEQRLWRRHMELAEIGATAKGGVDRQALSAEDAAARRLMATWAAELGLQASTDAIGNLFLRRPGREDAAAVLTGSHLDSQPTGGKFDGAYGVLAGLEALQAIEAAGIETRRPLEVVAWTNEEGSRFQPGVMGSGVFSGHMALDAMLEVTDRQGTNVRDALASFLAATPGVARRDDNEAPAAYIEAHIEQGPLLERDGKTIGVVQGVQGLRWFAIEVIGEAAHAGTTPLAVRRDALKAAAQMVGALEAAMADESDRVRFTVGRFEVAPNSPNTVPARVFFTIDFRHPEQAVIDALCGQVEPVCRANARGCEVRVTQTSDEAPAIFHAPVVDSVRRAAEALTLPHMDIMSGAGHDAMNLVALCPTGMIFVPCAGGVSHNEAEAATPADLAAGTRVLAAALVELADA